MLQPLGRVGRAPVLPLSRTPQGLRSGVPPDVPPVTPVAPGTGPSARSWLRGTPGGLEPALLVRALIALVALPALPPVPTPSTAHGAASSRHALLLRGPGGLTSRSRVNERHGHGPASVAAPAGAPPHAGRHAAVKKQKVGAAAPIAAPRRDPEVGVNGWPALRGGGRSPGGAAGCGPTGWPAFWGPAALLGPPCLLDPGRPQGPEVPQQAQRKNPCSSAPPPGLPCCDAASSRARLASLSSSSFHVRS